MRRFFRTKQKAGGNKIPTSTLFSGGDPGSTKIFQLFYPGAVFDVTAREVWESASAVTQCEKTIGTFESVGENRPCYLCGIIIPSRKNPKREISDELYPECEHILPIISARWYIDIYSSADQPKFTELRKEYAWAHRVCNQAKGNISFVSEVMDEDTREIELIPNKTAFQQALQSIKTRATTNIPKATSLVDRKLLEDIADLNIDARIAEIIPQKLAPIIAEVGKISENDYRLALLTRALKIVDPTRFTGKLKQKELDYIKDESSKDLPEESRTEFIGKATSSLSSTPFTLPITSFDVATIRTQFESKDGLNYTNFLIHVGQLLEEVKSNPTDPSTQTILINSVYRYCYFIELLDYSRKNNAPLETICAIHIGLKTLWKSIGNISSNHFNVKAIVDFPMEELDNSCKAIYATQEKEEEKSKKEEETKTTLRSETTKPSTEPEELIGELNELQVRADALKVDIKSTTQDIHTLIARRAAGAGEDPKLNKEIEKGERKKKVLEEEFRKVTNALEKRKREAEEEVTGLLKKRRIGQGRKTRRAKLFPRTRLTHRSDRSKKSKTQSSRKSRKGKSKKTTRY